MIRDAQPAATPPAGNRRAGGRLSLLAIFLAGPLVWSLHLTVSEFVLAGACAGGPGGFHRFMLVGTSGWRLVLLLITAIAILIVLAAELVALRAWQKSGAGAEPSGAIGGAAGRSGWLALGGMLLSGVFLVGIVLAGLPIFWLSGCT